MESIRTGSELSSGTAKAGETFDATLARDVVVGGKTIAKKGDAVKGKVTLAKSSGRLQRLGAALAAPDVGEHHSGNHESL